MEKLLKDEPVLDSTRKEDGGSKETIYGKAPQK